MQLIIGNKNYSSWSLRAWLALKASGQPFEEIHITLRQADTRAKILAWSPSGKVPCLIDRGLAIWDSLAIAEYLAEESPQLWPRDAAARAIARAISAEMHSGFQSLRNDMPMDIRAQRPGEGHTAAALADIGRIEAIWNDCRNHYAVGGPYLFGEYSIADMMFAPVCWRFDTYGVSLAGQAGEYLRTMLAHPHMREWQAGALHENTLPAQSPL